MTKAQIWIEVLRIVLSGPILTAGIILIAFAAFRTELRMLISRVATVKFPGGELTTSQEARTKAELPTSKEVPELAPPDPESLPQGMNLSQEDQSRLADFLQAQRALATIWEYRYLNYFLVHHTQRVLDWIASLEQRPSAALYDSMWMSTIPSANERAAVIGALQLHHLIQIDGPLLEITPKGKEYIAWRGPVPELPST